jgi:proteasome accessory factor B
MSAKLQRWTDLLAALLRRRFPVTFEDLVAEVPAYGRIEAKESLRRAFERDKAELRAFGVPIETVTDPATGETTGYRLLARNFYLPYLTLHAEEARAEPHTVDADGYRGLPRLAFEPDELAAVVEAGRRAERLGDADLAEHARSALRKLAVDLPLDAVRDDEARVLYDAERADPALLEALDEALARRKRVRFTYAAIGSGTTAERAVEPYGLFFLGRHWYLAAPEVDSATVKNWRLSRMREVVPNRLRPGSPDYVVPATFRLREHARSRRAWELGDGGQLEAIVDFPGTTGAAAAAARLGEAVPESDRLRRFRVRRLDAFVRWLLALGPAARPVAPDALVEEHRRQVAATLALYPDG